MERMGGWEGMGECDGGWVRGDELLHTLVTLGSPRGIWSVKGLGLGLAHRVASGQLRG